MASPKNSSAASAIISSEMSVSPRLWAFSTRKPPNSMSGKPENDETPAREEADALAASLTNDQGESTSLMRSMLSSGPSDDIPLDAGEPTIGGIRPGPGTGHEPADSGTLSPSSGEVGEGTTAQE